MVVAIVFFGLQEALLLYRPITGEYLDNLVFISFTYFVPEVRRNQMTTLALFH